MDKRGKSKDERQEKKEESYWKKAQRQAAQYGITLTKRKDSQGNYVCYMGKKSRNLLANL
jgi:hypothetical protein